MSDAPRETIGGRLSPQSADGWRTFADEHGVSISALLEAIGVALSDADQPLDSWASTIAAAREVDHSRRRRR